MHGLPPHQFKRLIEALRAEFQELRASLREQTASIRGGQEADRQTQEKIKANLAELRVPENEKAEVRAYRKKQLTVQVVLTIGTWLAFLAAGIYAFIAYRQLNEMRKATDAAKRSADVAETTLIATNRPWLDLDARLAGPLTMNEHGEARIAVEVKTENIGHSPAVSVSDAQSMIQVILLTPNPWQELKKVCDQATAQSSNPHNRGVTETIFPGRPYQQSMNLDIGKQELARSVNDIFPTAGHDPHIYPAIIWCVAYRADFSDVPHRTGYVWELKRRTPQGIVDIDRTATVPLNDLVLERSWPVPPFVD